MQRKKNRENQESSRKKGQIFRDFDQQSKQMHYHISLYNQSQQGKYLTIPANQGYVKKKRLLKKLSSSKYERFYSTYLNALNKERQAQSSKKKQDKYYSLDKGKNNQTISSFGKAAYSLQDRKKIKIKIHEKQQEVLNNWEKIYAFKEQYGLNAEFRVRSKREREIFQRIAKRRVHTSMHCRESFSNRSQRTELREWL